MQKGKRKKRVSGDNSLLSLVHNKTLVTYDPEADAAYFRIRKSKVAKTVELQDWLLADVDRSGRLLGIEMLFVSNRIPRKDIPQVLRAGKIPVVA